MRQAIACAIVAFLVVLAVPARAAETSDAGPAPEEKEPTLELLDKKLPVDAATGLGPANGYLVINSTARRAYMLYDKAWARKAEAPGSVIVQSFDLGTPAAPKLAPLRTVVIPNALLALGGTNIGAPGATRAGEVVHAVDDAGDRLFIGLASDSKVYAAQLTKDGRRPFSKVAVLDGRALDAAATGEESSAVSYITPPAAHSNAVNAHNLQGMTYVAKGTGQLVLFFAALNPVEAESPTGAGVSRPVFDHYLVTWDATSGQALGAPVLLEACQRASVITSPDEGFYQAALLVVPSAVYLGCQASYGVAQAVRIPRAADGSLMATGQESFPLPRNYSDTIADPASERLYFRATRGGVTWWVFDGPTRSWAGAVAAVNHQGFAVSAGVNPVTGRFYTLVPDYWYYGDGGSQLPARGGLQFTDGRLTPVPELTNVLPDMDYPAQFAIRTDPPTGRVFVRRGASGYGQYVYPEAYQSIPAPIDDYYLVFKDNIPVPEQPRAADLDRLTADVNEAADVTDATFTGTATGYGARVLLTGGASAATSSQLERSQSRCLPDDRELVLGQVRAAEVSNLSTSASAAGFHADTFTKDDLGEPASRCWPAAFGAPPQPLTGGIDSVAGQKWPEDADGFDGYTAECAAGGASTKSPERPAQHFDASAECDPAAPAAEATSSGALVAAPGAPPAVEIGAASSQVKTGRTANGVVTTVDSIARGIVIDGVGTIGAVRTETLVQAAGRPKTAKTTFTRTICGVDLPKFKQSGCMGEAQQKQFVAALNAALGRNGQARLREPDPVLAEGTPGGYQAAIQRSATEAFTDNTVSRDPSLAVPGLEIVFYRDDPQYGAGRQIFQFAGVQASSTYGIFCLYGPQAAEELETDADTTTTTTAVEATADTETVGTGDAEPVTSCALPPEAEPSTLEIALADVDMNPLAGGVFEIRVDSDVDGVVGADDELVDGGTCATAADGIGDCTFELGPGAYIITQTTAPAGYAPAPPLPQLVEPEMAYSVTFQNLRSVAGVQITLSDDSAEAKPLAGGVFELIADDGDGARGGLDLVYAGCTTTADGACPLAPAGAGGTSGIAALTEVVDTDVVGAVSCVEFEGVAGCLLEVPLGSYIAHQSAAPEGYLPGEDVAFTFDQPGQSAVLSFVNSKAVVGGGEFDPGEPGDPGEPPVPPTEMLVFDEGPGAPQPIVQSTPLSSDRSFGEGAADVLTQILQVPAQLLKLAFNSPREMALMGSVWALLFLPCYLGERRRLLARLALESHPGDTQ